MEVVEDTVWEQTEAIFKGYSSSLVKESLDAEPYTPTGQGMGAMSS